MTRRGLKDKWESFDACIWKRNSRPSTVNTQPWGGHTVCSQWGWNLGTAGKTDRMRPERGQGQIWQLCSQCRRLGLQCSWEAPGGLEAGGCSLTTTKVIYKRRPPKCSLVGSTSRLVKTTHGVAQNFRQLNCTTNSLHWARENLAVAVPTAPPSAGP